MDHDTEGDPGRQSTRADLVIRGGVIVTGDRDHDMFVGDVTATDGVIVGLAPHIDVAADREIDARGDIVVPGFVNCHTHQNMERGVFEDLPFFEWLNDFALPKDRVYEPRHMRAASLLCQAEMIRAGTTTFIDIFRFPHEAARVAVDSGVRCIISPQVIDDPVGPGETLETNEEFVDAWNGRHDRIQPWFGPHSLYTVKADTYRRMRELADRYGVGIHTHVAESRGETELVAERSGGLSPTAWLHELVGLGPDVVGAHCIELSSSDIELIATTGLGVAHCPTSNMKLGNGAAPIRELLAAGAIVGLGTDSVMTNNNLDPFEEMRQAGLLAKFVSGDATALDSATLFGLATLGSAKVLGMGDVIGSLEVGKRADLVVVDGHQPHAWPLFSDGGGNVVEQLVWACNGGDVKHTIVDGQVLLEDGRLTTIDLAEVEELVENEARHLFTSAGVIDHIEGRT
ncbi:amidohydrolase [soil metagenome]